MPGAVYLSVKESLFSFFFLAAIVLLSELMIAWILYTSHNLFWAMTMHLVIVSLLLLFVYYSSGQQEIRLAVFLLTMTGVTGPFGAAACLLAATVYVFFRHSSLSPDNWINSLLEDVKATENDILHERLDLGLENTSPINKVEPFYDILSNGTVGQKQMAIARMMRYFRPQFAPLLLRAAEDSNAAVRVQAATAMAKIEQDFMAKYMHLKKTLKNTTENSAARLDFANICDNYAHAGFLDEASTSSMRSQAIEIYKNQLEIRKDADLELRLARLYLRNNQPEKTMQLLNESIKSGRAAPATVFWYMESLFRMRKFTQLRLLMNLYAHIWKNFDGYKSPAETIDIISAWSETDIPHIKDKEIYAT